MHKHTHTNQIWLEIDPLCSDAVLHNLKNVDLFGDFLLLIQSYRIIQLIWVLLFVQF